MPVVARISSTDPLAGRIVLGLVVQALGVGIAVSADDDAVAALGWFLAGIGSIITLIGVIGWGVLVGLRAHEHDTRDG